MCSIIEASWSFHLDSFSSSSSSSKKSYELFSVCSPSSLSAIESVDLLTGEEESVLKVMEVEEAADVWGRESC